MRITSDTILKVAILGVLVVNGWQFLKIRQYGEVCFNEPNKKIINFEILGIGGLIGWYLFKG